MKMKLNFVPDKPTVNDRIYEMKDLQKIFNKVDIPVTSLPSTDGIVKIADIIGLANLIELSSEVIEFDVKPIKKDILEMAKNNKLTMSAIGDVKTVDIKDKSGLITERKKVVKDPLLCHLFIVH